MEIWETPVFTRQVVGALSDDEYRRMQLTLVLRPDAGPIIRGSGGIRKARWRAEGRRTRGGHRVLYYWEPVRNVIFMLFLFQKNEQEDLTPDQVRVLAAVVEEAFRPPSLGKPYPRVARRGSPGFGT